MYQAQPDEADGEAQHYTIFEEAPTDLEILSFAKKIGMHPKRDGKYLDKARECNPL